MPKGAARPIEERIAEKQRKRTFYLKKIQNCKEEISRLEKAEQRIQALLEY